MPVRTFGEGDLRVRFPSTLDVRDSTRTRNRSITPESVDANLIEDLLGDSDFELVKPLTVRHRRARGPLASGDEEVSEKLDLEVSLRGDDQAVVLMDRIGRLARPSQPTRAIQTARSGGRAEKRRGIHQANCRQ